MAAGIVNGVASCTFLSTLAGGQAVSNTFHITNEGSSPPDLATLNQLATDLAAWFTVTYKAMMTSGDTFNTITVRQVPDPAAPAPYEQAQVTVNVVGTHSGTGSISPDSACGVLKLKTAFASRNSRGHLFLPPNKIASEFNGDLYNAGSAYMTNGAALAAKFAAGASLSPTWTGTDLPSWFLCIYSKALQLRSEPSVFVCNAAVMDTKVHWLRSRERGSS